MNVDVTQYPLGTLALYGPDNQRATKLVAAIFKHAGMSKPNWMQRWRIDAGQAGDVRTDPVIQKEVGFFFQRYHVRKIVASDRIIGCPHEEGVDYQLGSACPDCPFWASLDRFTHLPKPKSSPGLTREQVVAELSVPPMCLPPKVGRNDRCPCGSERKYKKCCGAPQSRSLH